MGRHNFDDGATQLICWGDTTPMLGRRNFGWGDITWGDKAMGRHNLHSVNVRVYTREELFVIRAQNYRWSNNSLYYRLKSLGIFKYRGRRSGFSSNNQAIPAICSRRCRDDLCASYNFRQTFGSARLARKPSYNLITIESQATVPKISTVKPAASSQYVVRKLLDYDIPNHILCWIFLLFIG